MCESPEKLQELFLQKRESLLGKWVTLRLNDDSVIKLRIEGVGGRAVKLGKFMNYDKIFEEDDFLLNNYLKRCRNYDENNIINW